ncbi:MAG: AAA family ATPase [Bacteroidales bacterium]|nr:AAA family ATPase [Candidatus Physcousia equi]
MKHPVFKIELDFCTQRLQDALHAILQLAEHMRHEFITPELVLYVVSEQNEFKSFCKNVGVNLQHVHETLLNYLSDLDTMPEGEEYVCLLSSKSEEMFSRMASVHTKVRLPNGEPFVLPYTVSNLVRLLGTLDGTLAQMLLRDINALDADELFEKLERAYSADYRQFVHADAFPQNDQQVETAILRFPNGEDEPIKAEAFINGKRVEIKSGDFYKKLMASAGRLMQSLQKLGGKPGVEAPASDENPFDEESREREEWEQMVTCINETYKHHHPLVGRTAELDRCIRILCRRDKNNPIFVGEPGVGKTALIYGLVSLIEEGKVPQWLRGKRVYALDMNTLVAGASFHGELERRMKEVLEGASRRGNSIIYIDEIHTIAGASKNNNEGNTAEMLKPYLDDGALQIIGSTTYQDYNKTIGANKAMARRFSTIDVKEPSVEETIEILRNLTSIYEKHHGVRYTQEAVRYAVEQSHALIHDRFLPDKAIDLIDEAGALLRQQPLIGKSGKPKQARFQKVDVEQVKTILTDVCRISAKALSAESNDELQSLPARINKEIYGQDEAVKQVVRSVMMSKAGLGEPDKPLASLLFVGPTGVGKTEVCRVLARELGVELVRFDMSEYTEKHTVSKLIGSPAGYVGYEEGGLLTDAIRRAPNCVLLLDEIEKAHSDIYNILLQVMDYARLTDNKGNKVDFKNVILVMTSNAGAQFAQQAGIGFTGGQTKGQAMMTSVKKTFKPEFLNRLSATVVFNDMDEHMATLILDKKLALLSKRLAAKQVELQLSDAARSFLLKKGYTQQYGAREMDRVIQQHLTPLLMEQILFGKLKKGGVAHVDAADADALLLSVV